MEGNSPRSAIYARLLRNRAYARVFSAGLASVAGSAIASVCFVWIVYAETSSPLDVGLLGASFLFASILFSLVGGALVDRYDRRRLMISSDFARALAMGLVFLDLEFRGFDLVGILAAYFVLGVFTPIFNPAEQAIVPRLVSADLVADANGLVRSSRSALQFAGASLGGVLIVTVGGNTGIGLNALTFLVSGLLLVGMVVPGSPKPARAVSAPRPGYFREIAEGFRWLWAATGFLELTASAMVFNFCQSLVATFLVVFSILVLHGSALVYALVLASEFAGTAIGSLLVGPAHAERYAGKAWVVAYGVLGGLAALVAVLFPTAPVAVGAFFALGVVSGFAGTAWLTAAQLLVPTEMQGRYFGIDNLGSIAIIPAAQIGGAFLIEATGIRSAYLAVGLLWFLAGLAFLAPGALRRLGVRPGGPSPTLRTAADGAGTRGSPEGTRDA